MPATPPTSDRPDAATTEPETSTSPVRVLAIGDSFVAWSSWPTMFAATVESELGRPVQLDTSLAVGGGSPRLGVIRDNEQALARIGAADIIIVQPQPGFAASPPMNAYLTGSCGGAANTDCFTTAADDYRTYVADYLDLVTSRARETAVVRVVTTGTWVMDAVHPKLRDEHPDELDDLIGLVDTLMAVVIAEAEARSIPVVDVNTVFNGPTHRELTPDGYLKSDRMHLADAGSAVVAQLLADLGFAPLDEM